MVYRVKIKCLSTRKSTIERRKFYSKKQAQRRVDAWNKTPDTFAELIVQK